MCLCGLNSYKQFITLVIITTKLKFNQKYLAFSLTSNKLCLSCNRIWKTLF